MEIDWQKIYTTIEIGICDGGTCVKAKKSASVSCNFFPISHRKQIKENAKRQKRKE